jgi:hypothetical protein
MSVFMLGVVLAAASSAYAQVTWYVDAAAPQDVPVRERWAPRSATIAAPSCPGESLFAQRPNDPNGGIVSDLDYLESIAFETFVISGSGSDLIYGVRWWGTAANLAGPCVDTDDGFQISFYEDEGGEPGDQVCTYDVTAAAVDTGLLLNGTYSLYEFSVALQESCALREGWISIQSRGGETSCHFVWAGSMDGDMQALWVNSSYSLDLWFDLAVCLTTDPDGDEDGVTDRWDDCPGTPECASVDADGCPSDADGDGVMDGCDDCSGTPTCATNIDADGCAIDTDGDGVVDGCGDDTGQERDDDGDGVTNDLDECPNTPAGAAVDANGCPTGCCGASGPVAPLGLAIGMLLLSRFAGHRGRRPCR